MKKTFGKPGRTSTFLLAGVLGMASGGAAVWAMAGGAQLLFNGNVISTSVRVMDGRAYAPIQDIAKALDMVAVQREDGQFEIKKAGGANPIEGLQGKIGDVIFDGKWRFQVLSAGPVASYKMQHEPTADYAIYNPVAEFDHDTRIFTAKGTRTLIAVRCRVTNARNKGTHGLWVANTDTHTALADKDGESHPPIAYDLDVSEPFHSKQLVPGAKTDFTVLFSVPEGTVLKDLIFTLRTLDNNDKGSDARISLTAN